MWAAIRRAINDNLSEPLNVLINRLIGAANNTGGSATAGTAMAKLNNVQTQQTNLIGAVNATGGTATAGSANAKLNALLTNYTAARAPALDRIGTANPTVSDRATVMNFLREINERLQGGALGGVAAVKSVQRGTVLNNAFGDQGVNETVTVTISAVAPNKSSVSITAGTANATIRVSSLTTTAITFSKMGTVGQAAQNATSVSFSWQVVEYY
jgi:hypothetical protein